MSRPSTAPAVPPNRPAPLIPALLLAVVGAAVSCTRPHHQAASLPLADPTTPQTSITAAPRPSSTRASRSRDTTPRPRPRPDTGTGSLLSSTAYCETGLMANGHHTRIGAVAGNLWPLGTRLHVTDSPYGPGTFTVSDRIGHGSQLDYAMPGDCTGARQWGRHTVHVKVIP